MVSLAAVASWQLLPELTSDHFATVSVLRLENLPVPPSKLPRRDFRKVNWELFRNTCQGCYEENGEAVQSNVQDQYCKLATVLHVATNAAFLKARPAKCHFKDLWYCSEHHVDMAGKNLGNTPTVENRLLLQEVVRKLTRKLR